MGQMGQTTRLAVVTGGMGGLGEAICRRLANEKFTVVALHQPGNGTARDWLATHKANGYDFESQEVDVSNFDSCAKAMAAVRPISQIRIWGRNARNAEALAATLRNADMPAVVAATVAEAVADADIVCTTTPAATPILHGQHVRPGTHVNLVGSAIPTTAEADTALVAMSQFYGDYREATLAQAGEFRNAIAAGLITADHLIGEIGELILGRIPGRQDDTAITLYKSLGVTAQDLTAADAILEAARAHGMGHEINLA
jgi:ornithine cyclodeaminase